MKVTRPHNILRDERVVAVVPPMSDRVDKHWSGRLNYTTGRTLTARALELEQQHRSGHLTMLGRQLSPGTVSGLVASVTRDAVLPGGHGHWARSPLERATDIYLERQFKEGIGLGTLWKQTFFRWTVHVSPGLGLTAAGEDVTLNTPFKVDVEKLPVLGRAWDPAKPPRGLGVLLLQPVTAEIIPRQVSGSATIAATPIDWFLGADSASSDPCEPDPGDDPFSDWQVVDGCRLGFFPWPADWGVLPPADKRFRNQIVQAIFRREAAAGEGTLPWEQLGVPLGLVHISRYGSVTFLDRFAVVRQGGSREPRRPLLPGSGTPYLWQARMQEFFDQVRELRASGLNWDDTAAAFRFLPPIGMLPADVLSVSDYRIDFFPPSYDVAAVPVPEEQLEVALEQTAGLAPFDLEAADRVRLLVPVPQQYFEPRLLKREEVDPIFNSTIGELLDGLGGSLGERTIYWEMAVAVAGAIDPETVPVYPLPDPATLPGETVGSFTPDAAHNHGVRSVAAVTALRDLLLQRKAPLKPAELAEFDPAGLADGSFKGLRAIIADLEAKIAISDHAIDFGFLKLQTDIYRVRQVMLSNVQATRLATSPVLASIAQGESSYATGQKLSSYFQEASKPLQMNAILAEAAITLPAKAAMSKAASAKANAASAAIAGTASLESMSLKNTALSNYSSLATDKATMINVSTADVSAAGRDDVVAQQPITGEPLDFRTTSVAERIKDPPAAEAKSYALATKAGIVASMVGLPINLEEIEVGVSSPDTALVPLEEFTKILEASKDERIKKVLIARAQIVGAQVVVNVSPLTVREKELLGEMAPFVEKALAQRRGTVRLPLTTAGLDKLIMSGVLYQNHPDGDEASFLGVGVSALENATSILRRVEGRIKSYRDVVAACRKTLELLDSCHSSWRTDIATIDLAVANQRHDLTVARALLAEEQARVNAINTRRSDIIREHVKLVLFTRQRSITTANSMPTVVLHGVYQDPVPACLAGTLRPPAELRQMVRVLRDVPLTWLPAAWPILLKLDRPELLREVYVFARDRASARIAVPLQAPATTAAAFSSSAQALQSVIDNHQAIALNMLQQKATIDLAFFAGANWKLLRNRAQNELSLADLIESGRGSGLLARQAAHELEQIEHVAACFHARCDDVTPAVRLRWAELISVFDRPLSLRSLTALPAWAQLDQELRRDLQRLLDWLFGRINPKVDAAVTLMNDLVRVTILLTCHAPVSAIMDGHLPKPSRVVVGGFLDLQIDRGDVGIGMQVAIHAGSTVVVRGVVEDLFPGAARVQVTHAQSANLELQEGAVAKFYPALEVATFSSTR